MMIDETRTATRDGRDRDHGFRERRFEAGEREDRPQTAPETGTAPGLETPTPHAHELDTDDTIGLYMKDVGSLPLLTQEQEIALAQRIERGRKAREALAAEPVSAKRRRELQHLIEDGWAAREHLITANSRLVISVAKKYLGRGVPFSDLIQEGNVGLLRATKKFDYRLGHKFSTYATWWIRQAITRGIADHGRTIRLPVHMTDQINRVMRSYHALTQELGRSPSTEELADAVSMPPDKIEYMLKVSQRPLSLEMPTNEEEDSTLGEFIEDRSSSPPAEAVAQGLLHEQIQDLLLSLPPREARVLQLRYGFGDGRSHTLEEVGRKVGVTRERVRQIEAQAMRRLRQPGIRHKLAAYLGE